MRAWQPLLSMALVYGVAACATSPTETPASDAHLAEAVLADAGADFETSGPDSADVTAVPDVPALPPLTIPAGCNPIAADLDCLLPYPSDVFLVNDASLPSQRRVVLPVAGLPVNAQEKAYTMDALAPQDGFSHLPQILALLTGPIAAAGLPTLASPNASLGATSPTVIIEASTGRRILHIAELDIRSDEPTRRGLNLRPLERLKNGTRYVVAIRALKQEAGTAVPVPEGFRRLRDQQTAGDPTLGPLAARYETEVFGVLATAGVPRADLVLAWDFTTETELNVAGDLLAIRSQALAAMEAAPPAVTVTEVTTPTPTDDAWLVKRVTGTLAVPRFVSSDAAGSRIARAASGKPTQNGVATVPFRVLIPRSVVTASNEVHPMRVLQFGHGFFGDCDEADGEFVKRLAHEKGFVVVCVDWWGMSDPDRAIAAGDIASDPPMTLRFTDRVHQGMVNQLAVTYAVKGPLGKATELFVDGKPVMDPAQLFWYGISQGHILGGTYLALTPHVQRGVLSVGGAGLGLMMFRARPFVAFLGLFSVQNPDALEAQKLVALTQPGLDRIDPITYAPHVLSDLLPGSSTSRAVLMHVGLGDAEVPNVGTLVHARALGLPILDPAPLAIDWLEHAADGTTPASALVVYDFGVKAPLPGWLPKPADSGNDVHEGVRRAWTSMVQVDAFLRPTGSIVRTCDGPCDAPGDTHPWAKSQ